MQSAVWFLTGLFSYVLFPIIVIGVFVFLAALDFKIIAEATSTSNGVRRTVGVVLPFVVLVFFVTTDNEAAKEISIYLQSLSNTIKIFAGAAIAITLMESGKWLGDADIDAAAATYAMFVSSIITFVIWAFLGNFFNSLCIPMLAFIVAGGLHIIFRGFPDWFVDLN